MVTAYNESIGKSNVLARISTDSATSSDFNNGLSLTNDTVTQNNAIKKTILFRTGGCIKVTVADLR